MTAEQLHIRQVGGIERSQHALAGDLVETDRRNADRLALQVLTGDVAIAGIAIQCDRNQIVIRIIADEINDDNRILAACLTQSASKLLREDDARLGLPEHHNLVDMRNIHTFIEQVDRENVIQLAILQLFNGKITLRLGMFAGNRLCAIRTFRLLVDLLIEQSGQALRLFAPTAEDQTLHVGAGFAVQLDFVDDIAHAAWAGELLEPMRQIVAFLLSPVARLDLLAEQSAVRGFLNVLVNPIIMKRAEHVLFKRPLQTDLIRHVVAE